MNILCNGHNPRTKYVNRLGTIYRLCGMHIIKLVLLCRQCMTSFSKPKSHNPIKAMNLNPFHGQDILKP